MPLKAGRKQIYQDAPMDKYDVRMTAWHARKARKIGNGNLGEGVRSAIERAVQSLQEFDESQPKKL